METKIKNMLERHNGVKVERPLVTWLDGFGIPHTHYVEVIRYGNTKVLLSVVDSEGEDFHPVEYSSIQYIHGKIVGNCIEKTNPIIENVNIEDVFTNASELIKGLIRNYGWCGKDAMKLNHVGEPKWFDKIEQFFRTSYRTKDGKFEVVNGATHTKRMGYDGEIENAQAFISMVRCSLQNMICHWWAVKDISNEDKVKLKMIYDEFNKHLTYRSKFIPKEWIN